MSLFGAAQALLSLAVECLEENCSDYARVFVDSAPPVVDCSTLAVVMGGARGFSGSCVGRLQYSANLDITMFRCCEPTPKLTEQGGYSPPSPESIENAVACLARDAEDILGCVICSACSILNDVEGFSGSCCDETSGPPEIIWGNPQGLCRSVIVRVPVNFTVCCD